jgi:hypothetical protein
MLINVLFPLGRRLAGLTLLYPITKYTFLFLMYVARGAFCWFRMVNVKSSEDRAGGDDRCLYV